ncbi:MULTISPECIES: hypothetical protein [unclassified Bacillus (in: firmicutes)]
MRLKLPDMKRYLAYCGPFQIFDKTLWANGKLQLKRHRHAYSLRAEGNF